MKAKANKTNGVTVFDIKDIRKLPLEPGGYHVFIKYTTEQLIERYERRFGMKPTYIYQYVSPTLKTRALFVPSKDVQR
jgi:hypothetical protein